MNPRVLPAAFSIALIGATLWPLARKPIEDDFPLSTYPMFAWRRPTALTMSYAVGITQTGTRRYLRPVIAGSYEVLQARAIIERGVKGTPRERGALCTRIAERVTAFPEFADVVTIAIVTGTHDSVEFLLRDHPGTVVERTRCSVTRSVPRPVPLPEPP